MSSLEGGRASTIVTELLMENGKWKMRNSVDVLLFTYSLNTCIFIFIVCGFVFGVTVVVNGEKCWTFDGKEKVFGECRKWTIIVQCLLF